MQLETNKLHWPVHKMLVSLSFTWIGLEWSMHSNVHEAFMPFIDVSGHIMFAKENINIVQKYYQQILSAALLILNA